MTRRLAAGERTVNGIRTFDVRTVRAKWRAVQARPGRLRAAVQGRWRSTATTRAASPVPTTWQTRASPLASRSSRACGELLDDLDRPRGVEVEPPGQVVEQGGEHRPVGAQQRRLAALEQRREVAVGLGGVGLEALLGQPAPGAQLDARGDGVRLDGAQAALGGRGDHPGHAVGGEHPAQGHRAGVAEVVERCAWCRRPASPRGRRRGRAARARAARCRAARSAAAAPGRAAGRGRGRSRAGRAPRGPASQTTSSISLSRCPSPPVTRADQ